MEIPDTVSENHVSFNDYLLEFDDETRRLYEVERQLSNIRLEDLENLLKDILLPENVTAVVVTD